MKNSKKTLVKDIINVFIFGPLIIIGGAQVMTWSAQVIVNVVNTYNKVDDLSDRVDSLEMKPKLNYELKCLGNFCTSTDRSYIYLNK